MLYYFLTDPENSSFWRSWERNASIWRYRCGWHCTWNSRVPYHIWGTSLSVWYGMFIINLISAFPKTPTVPHLWQQKFWLATMEPSILFLDILLQLDVQHEMNLVLVKLITCWSLMIVCPLPPIICLFELIFNARMLEFLVVQLWRLCYLLQFLALKDVNSITTETMLLLWSMRERHNPSSKFKMFFETLPSNFNTGISS